MGLIACAGEFAFNCNRHTSFLRCYAHVGSPEVLPFEKQGLVQALRQSVRKAISEIQSGRMVAFSELSVRSYGRFGLDRIKRTDNDLGASGSPAAPATALRPLATIAVAIALRATARVDTDSGLKLH